MTRKEQRLCWQRTDTFNLTCNSLLDGCIMFFELLSIYSYEFMQRALLASILIAVPSAIAGYFLVMRKLSMLGDGIAHISLLGVVTGIIIKINPIISAVALSGLSTVIIEHLKNSKVLRSDLSLTLLFIISLAISALLISKFKLYSLDIMSLFFGSIIGITHEELLIMFFLSLISTLILYLFRYYFLLFSYDHESSSIFGVNSSLIGYVFAFLTGIIIAFSIKIAGILLISVLLLLPTLIANRIAKGFDYSIIVSIVVSLLTSFFGVTLSYLLDIPVGACIAITFFTIYVITLVVK
ncbi:MAG: metal ABC transporter permease [Candidatus Micrarchaeota archaeon]|nr:metal ABC transporter permease [Candidatus Micrarchaeota archaeon]